METTLHFVSPEEIKVKHLFSRASIVENRVFSKDRLVKERKRDIFTEYIIDTEQPLDEANSANAQKLLKLEKVGLLDSHKSYEKYLKWLKDLTDRIFQIDLPNVNWKEIKTCSRAYLLIENYPNCLMVVSRIVIILRLT